MKRTSLKRALAAGLNPGALSIRAIRESLGDKAAEKQKARMRRIIARHRRKYPEKEKARQAAGRAIRSGKLVKQPCQFTGCNSLKVQAHHEDYSKPLEITWLCRRHHRQLHIVMRWKAKVSA